MIDRDNIFITVPQRELLTAEFEEYLIDTLANSLEGKDEYEVFLIQPSVNAPVVFVKNRNTNKVSLFQLVLG